MNDLIKVCMIALKSLKTEEVRVQQDFIKEYEEQFSAGKLMHDSREFEQNTYVLQELSKEVNRIMNDEYARLRK